LAVVEPGKVVVYPILMDDTLPPPVLSDTEAAGYAKFRGMLSGSTTDITSTVSTRKSRKAAGLWLDSLLFRLLTDAARDIHRCAPSLTVQQVLSLVGRALFFRFLVDRRIVSEAELPRISRQA